MKTDVYKKWKEEGEDVWPGRAETYAHGADNFKYRLIHQIHLKRRRLRHAIRKHEKGMYMSKAVLNRKLTEYYHLTEIIKLIKTISPP